MSAMSPSGFDRIAPYYDFLARLVFGKSIVRTQTYFLDQIPDRATVLILGGGTGWILNEIMCQTEVSRIWYIDASHAMVRKAKEKNVHAETIQFIVGALQDLPSEIRFDVVITNFYLDLFTDDHVRNIIHDVKGRLNQKGYWLVSDFVNSSNRWHRLLLWSMYRFFKIVCRIETAKLPSWELLLEGTQLLKLKEKYFYSGFIKSVVYRT